MRNRSILRCALAVAVGCGLASAAFAIQNTQPMKGHPDWGYTIYGLPGEGSTKQTAYVFTNQNAALSWKAPSDVSSVRLLVVGGGGAGGGKYNTTKKDAGFGGGGGGGFTEVDSIGVTPGDTYAIDVGEGGAATTSMSGKGEMSSFIGTGVEARADGGGYGGTYNGVGTDGASGGGGGGGFASNKNVAMAGGKANGIGLGHDGAYSTLSADASKGRGGGGGGGAGSAGSTTETKNGGAGGEGMMSDITGSEVYYAGGGGGGGNDTSGGAGGIGGGGKGGQGNGTHDGDTGTKHGGAGTDGLGGGGGGSAAENVKIAGGKGGSGVVIVRCNESVEDPNPHPEGHDPMEISWTGLGADAKWTTRENWSTGSDDQLYYFDTAIFPASCTAAVTMDKTTDAEYPAAALLSIGANANVTLGGSKVNYFAGNKAMKLMGDGATLTVTGAGNSVVIQNKGCYAFGENVTVKAAGGAKLDLPRMDDCLSIDLNGVKGLKFVADGADSWLDFRAGVAQQADVRFEAVNGGQATPQGYLSGADSTMTVVAASGGNFDARYFNLEGALVKLTVAGEGSKLTTGAFNDVAEGSTICITNADMSFHASYHSGYKTQLGVSGATTIELIGANPRIKKIYHDGPCAYGEKLTVKLRPEASWSTGSRIYCEDSSDYAWTVSSGVHYEIDCSALAPKQELTFRLYELKGSTGDSVAAPAAGNVKLTGTNANGFDVSLALSADGKKLDCTLKPKKFGFIFSIR